MSKRKINIRKSCDEIDAIAELLILNLACNYNGMGRLLKKISHRIKRTTWRGRETKIFIQKPSTTNMEVKLDVEQIPYY